MVEEDLHRSIHPHRKRRTNSWWTGQICAPWLIEQASQLC